MKRRKQIVSENRYRLLSIGESVKDGDEEYAADELMDEPACWRPVAVEFINEVVQENDPPVRRKEESVKTNNCMGDKTQMEVASEQRREVSRTKRSRSSCGENGSGRTV